VDAVADTSDRTPPNVYHDEKERTEVGEILKDLPPEHPARVAYRLGVGPLELSHLVKDEELANRLKLAYLDGHGRMLRRHRPG
jgi:hypothetical protein